MANVTLKISKAAYEAKILSLQNYLNQLDTKIAQYETLKNNMDKFIDGSDDNYEAIRNNVETNINAVRKAHEMTEASIKMLQETLKNQEEFNEQLGRTVDEGSEFAKNTISTAVKVMKMIE